MSNPTPTTPPERINIKAAKPKKSGSILGFLVGFLSLITIVVILAVVIFFTYITSYPKSEVAKKTKDIVLNSPIGPVLDNGNTQNTSLTENSNSNNNSNKSSFENTAPVQFSPSKDAKNVSEVVDQVLPTVLSIRINSRNGNLINSAVAAGTGYIVSKDGLVITNKHVIDVQCNSNTKNSVSISALSYDNKAYNLELLTIDPIDDIAILKMQNPPDNLPKVEFADSNELKLGQEVIAIGNALGQFQDTVTKGIISGLNRSFGTGLQDKCNGREFRPDGLIQTDAAINKGNSGGPLFDSSGRVVGMNSLGATDSQNIGLAIPSSTLVFAINSFIKNNRIVRARLGVSSQTIDPVLKKQYNWLPTDYGEIILQIDNNGQPINPVAPGSAADKAGLKQGDIITEINGQKLLSNSSNNPSPLRRFILSKQPGEEIDVKIFRAKSSTTNSFEYNPQPENIKVKLSGVSYNTETFKEELIL